MIEEPEENCTSKSEIEYVKSSFDCKEFFWQPGTNLFKLSITVRSRNLKNESVDDRFRPDRIVE